MPTEAVAIGVTGHAAPAASAGNLTGRESSPRASGLTAATDVPGELVGEAAVVAGPQPASALTAADARAQPTMRDLIGSYI